MVNNLEVHITFKKIKRLNLSVRSPDGDVRVSAPKRTTLKEIHAFVSSHLEWIHQQKAKIFSQPKPVQLAANTGETHWLWGKPYRLEVNYCGGFHKATVRGDDTMQLFIKRGTSVSNRLKVIDELYRDEIEQRMPGLLQKWETIIGEDVNAWGIKKMKTRWGTCNIEDRRVWVSLELAKKPPECLEYIVVHEMVHLLERTHNARFKAFMDQYLPDWRSYDAILNKALL